MNRREAEELGFQEAKAHPILIFGLYGICASIAWNLPVHWILRMAAFFALTFGVGFVRMVLLPAAGVLRPAPISEPRQENAEDKPEELKSSTSTRQALQMTPTQRSMAEAFADELFCQIAKLTHGSGNPNEFGVPQIVWFAFFERKKLYVEALVSLSLMQGATDDEFRGILLEAFAKRILRDVEPNQAADKAKALDEAIKELDLLIKPGTRPLCTWSENWMTQIGYRIDPAQAMLFSVYWIDMFANVSECMAKLVTALKSPALDLPLTEETVTSSSALMSGPRPENADDKAEELTPSENGGKLCPATIGQAASDAGALSASAQGDWAVWVVICVGAIFLCLLVAVISMRAEQSSYRAPLSAGLPVASGRASTGDPDLDAYLRGDAARQRRRAAEDEQGTRATREPGGYRDSGAMNMCPPPHKMTADGCR